ncbi:dihydropteroate synthase [Mesobaculum littorinae]
MRALRPIPRLGLPRGTGGLPLAGSATVWFDMVEYLARGEAPRTLPLDALTDEERARLSAPRPRWAGLGLDRPRIMGILNVTPDSFSDGGAFDGADRAQAHARVMQADGAAMLDIGGESTRPGAVTVPVEDEIARTAPVIAALRAAGVALPISIDTRKAPVAEAALAAGATAVNDVSAMHYDPAMAEVVAARAAPVVLMHTQGGPETMQDDPRYDDVLLDVHDHLAAQVAAAEVAGIPRDRIMVDPGVGFGKTVAHNLALLARLSLFHNLGCAVLLGASRKGFVGRIGGAAEPRARMPGSVAVALAGAAQGVHMLRVHDVAETVQALALWQAVTTGEAP